jgi:hypothetical protein
MPILLLGGEGLVVVAIRYRAFSLSSFVTVIQRYSQRLSPELLRYVDPRLSLLGSILLRIAVMWTCFVALISLYVELLKSRYILERSEPYQCHSPPFVVLASELSCTCPITRNQIAGLIV